MLLLKNIDLIENKTLRSTPNMRVLLDVGEVNGEIAKKLHEFRTCGPQKLAVIIMYMDDLEDLGDLPTGLEESNDSV